MSTYFPFLRGKREELRALTALSGLIARSASVIPIISPVNSNATTRNSFEHFTETGMQFVFVTNPQYGRFSKKEEVLYQFACGDEGELSEYDNYIPALFVYRDTDMRDIKRFTENYKMPFRAMIYESEPASDDVRKWCLETGGVYYQILLEGKVDPDFIQAIPASRRVLMRDNFRRRARNADYPQVEKFTDLNTAAGNPDNLNWGDYSTHGNWFSEEIIPDTAVAIHHIHFREGGDSLDISHFLSDRRDTMDDPAGKTMEAAGKLVENLDSLLPNDTVACGEYREMVDSGRWRGLGYLKRLGIMQQLEILAGDV